ncbi:hypothetical protein [Geodermatophilus sp. SYSU D00815]
MDPDSFSRMAAAARKGADPERREDAVYERLLAAYAQVGVRP